MGIRKFYFVLTTQVLWFELNPVQVDTYREEGKEEAAARLEDQLTLIHSKFQVNYILKSIYL